MFFWLPLDQRIQGHKELRRRHNINLCCDGVCCLLIMDMNKKWETFPFRLNFIFCCVIFSPSDLRNIPPHLHAIYAELQIDSPCFTYYPRPRPNHITLHPFHICFNLFRKIEIECGTLSCECGEAMPNLLLHLHRLIPKLYTC